MKRIDTVKHEYKTLELVYAESMEKQDMDLVQTQILDIYHDAACMDIEIESVSYFSDRIRLYYNNRNEFVELSLFGFAKDVTEPLYDDNNSVGCWRHSDDCLYY